MRKGDRLRNCEDVRLHRICQRKELIKDDERERQENSTKQYK
jgi:hypothetical protein